VWTDKNRAKYSRDHLRYPSDLTNDEWAYVEPLIPPAKRGGGNSDDNSFLHGVFSSALFEIVSNATNCRGRALVSVLHDSASLRIILSFRASHSAASLAANPSSSGTCRPSISCSDRPAMPWRSP
jgi:hypothetical protein